jgi:glycerol dehydrogenase
MVVTVAAITSFPGKYVQGAGILDRLADFVDPKYSRFVLLADPIVLGLVKEKILKSLFERKKECVICDFNGESSEFSINRLKQITIDSQADCIIGAGGGKAMDTTRAAGYYLRLPVVVVPTIAATDAPVSSLFGIYSDEHAHIRTVRTGKNPNYAIVDTQLIVDAPIRFLIAGMGDALSTKFEADAVFQSQGLNMHEGRPTATSVAIASLAYQIITENGEAAVEAASQHRVTPDVERVIEANILLSGVGFESAGLAAAHGIHTGLTVLPEIAAIPHGEKVAFTTLVQIQMEEKYANRSDSVFNQLASFYCKVGLPLTLKQIGIGGTADEVLAKLKRVAAKSCQKGGYVHNMSFPITESLLCEEILATDKRGERYL